MFVTEEHSTAIVSYLHLLAVMFLISIVIAIPHTIYTAAERTRLVPDPEGKVVQNPSTVIVECAHAQNLDLDLHVVTCVCTNLQ